MKGCVAVPRSDGPEVSTVNSWSSTGLFYTALLALVLGTVLRASVNADEALWFDEVWTATIAVQDLHGALEMLRDDIIAPFYYMFIWAWSKVAGLSDFSLRLPGMIASIAAPGAAWLLLRGRIGAAERALLVVMIALWIPGLYYAQEARSYGFMLLGAVLQAAFLLRAIVGGGSRGDIAGWAMAGLFLGLTHYTTLALSAAQGIALLAFYWRTRFGTLVLAGLAYLPAFAAIYLQSDSIDRFSDYDHFWIKPLTVRDLARMVAFFAGSRYFVPFLALGLGAAVLVDAIRSGRSAAGQGFLSAVLSTWRARLRAAPASPLFVTGCITLAGLGLFLGIAVFRPLFEPRYLLPFAPGLLMLIVWLVSAMPPVRRWAGGALAGLYFAAALVWAGVSISKVEKGLTWGDASAALASEGADEAVFFLDQGHPIPYDDAVREKVFSFYFVRDGVPSRMGGFLADYRDFSDPRPALQKFLTEKPGRAVVWTLHPGPLPHAPPDSAAAPDLSDPARRAALIRARGFSAVYRHTALSEIKGVSCRTVGADWYPKYVCVYEAPGRSVEPGRLIAEDPKDRSGPVHPDKDL